MAANEWSLTARGIFSLFIPWLSVTPFAKSDVEHEATVNNAFARMSESQRDDYRKAYEIEVKKRMKTFRSGVWGSFWLLISAVVIALILSALCGFRGAQASIGGFNGGNNFAGRGGGRFAGGVYHNGYGRGLGFAGGLAVGGALGYGFGYGGYYGDDYYANNDYYDGNYDSGQSYAVSSGQGDNSGYCAQRYKSYDPASGTYLGYDGLRHPCE